jgi:O-antigen/teichoic acid export membrane protein
MISFPALVGFGVIAPDAVPALYGEKWVEAGEVAQIFAFMVVPFTLNYFASPVLSALGKGSHMRTLAVLQLVLTVSLTMLAVPYGVFAVACAYVGRAYLTLPVQMWYLWRGAGITVKDSMSAVAAPFFASAIMGVGVWGVLELTRPHIHVQLITVAIGVAAGVVLYGGSLLGISARARNIAYYRLQKLGLKGIAKWKA